MKTKKERIFYYDVLRAFAIIAVIICHVDMFFGPLTSQTQVIAQMTFHDIGRIGVPIFLMISGALLLNRDYPDFRPIIPLSIQFNTLMESIYWRTVNHMVFLDTDWDLSIHSSHKCIHPSLWGEGNQVLFSDMVHHNDS